MKKDSLHNLKSLSPSEKNTIFSTFFPLHFYIPKQLYTQERGQKTEEKKIQPSNPPTGSSTLINTQLEFTAAPFEVKKIQILLVSHSRRVVRRALTGGGSRRRGNGAPRRRGRRVTGRDRLDEGDDWNGQWTGRRPLLPSSHFGVSVTGAAGGTS